MSTIKVDVIEKTDGQEYFFTNKNRLINSDFSVWQRGTSITDSTTFTNADGNLIADRWRLLSDTNNIVDLSQETTTVPTNQLTAIKLDVETVNKKFGISQAIEQKDCIGLIGKTCTFSFKAKVSDTSKLDNIKCAIISWTGTANAPTADIISDWEDEGTNPSLVSNFTYENTPANLSVTTSYQTYSVSASIDTSSAKNIVVFIWSDVTDTTAGHHLFITDCQLEASPRVTSYEREKFSETYQKCLRYTFIIKGDTDGGGLRYFGISGNSGSVGFQLPQPMFKQPNIATSGMELRDGGDTSRTISSTNSYFNAIGEYDRVRIFSSSIANGTGTLRFPNEADRMVIKSEVEA